MAGVIKVDRVQSDSNLAFNIAGANVAFMDASALRLVGSSIVANGTTIVSGSKVVASAQPTGAVLQVLQTVKTDGFSFGSGTWTDVTGFSVAITPSSTSSKILVMFSAYACQQAAAGTYGIHLRLVRNSTTVYVGDASGIAQQSSAQIGSTNYHYAQNLSGIYLDSPATTSSITYKLQTYIESGQSGFIGGSYNTSVAYDARNPSQITVMEIAG
jgi:hypothetical protein